MQLILADRFDPRHDRYYLYSINKQSKTDQPRDLIMRVMTLTGIRQMEMIEAPTPTIKHDDDVLIKIEAVGVCGSDVHYYTTGRIGSQVVKFPFPVGHECAGIVESVGTCVLWTFYSQYDACLWRCD